jgi:hypothetical protein
MPWQKVKQNLSMEHRLHEAQNDPDAPILYYYKIGVTLDRWINISLWPDFLTSPSESIRGSLHREEIFLWRRIEIVALTGTAFESADSQVGFRRFALLSARTRLAGTPRAAAGPLC